MQPRRLPPRLMSRRVKLRRSHHRSVHPEGVHLKLQLRRHGEDLLAGGEPSHATCGESQSRRREQDLQDPSSPLLPWIRPP